MNTNALPQTGGIPLTPQAAGTRRRYMHDDAPVYDQPQPAMQQPAQSEPTPLPNPGLTPSQQQQFQPGSGAHQLLSGQQKMQQTAPMQQPQADTRPPEQQLQEAIGHASDMLITASTVFPFTLFPDTVTVDRSKLSVTKRFFFAISEAFSIRIEDILNVTADVGPFFGSVRITTRFFTTEKKPYSVNYLWRSDALRLKRILQGYIIATTKNIDSSSMPADRLADMLDELGKGAPAD